MANIDYSKMTDEELITYMITYSADVQSYSEDLCVIRQILEDRHNGIKPEPKALTKRKGMYSYNSQVSYATSEEANMAKEKDLAIAELLLICDYVEGKPVCYTPGWSADNGAWVSVLVTDKNVTHPYRFATNASCLKAIETLGKRKLDLIFNFKVGPKHCPCPPCPPYPPCPPCPPCPPPPFPPPPVPPCPPRPEELSVWLEIEPMDGYYEVGEEVQQPIKMIAHVHGRAKVPALIQFSRDDSVLYSIPYISGTDDRYVYEYFDPRFPIKSDTKFEVAVVAGTTVVQDEKWYLFRYGCYAGYSDDGSVPSSLDSLNRILIEQGNIEYKFTCYDKYPLVAYPAYWGELVRIYDENGFTITQTFNRELRLYTLKDGSQVSYYVYVIDHPVMINNYKMRFLFKEG